MYWPASDLLNYQWGGQFSMTGYCWLGLQDMTPLPVFPEIQLLVRSLCGEHQVKVADTGWS